MANTLDLIIKLVIQNQDAVKKLGEELKALGAIELPNVEVDEDSVDTVAQVLTEALAKSQALNRSLSEQIPDRAIKLTQEEEEYPEESLGFGEGLSSIASQSIPEAIELAKKLKAVYDIANDLKSALNLADGNTSQEFAAIGASLKGFDSVVPIVESFEKLKSLAFPELPTDEAVRFAQNLELSSEAARKLQKQLDLPTGTIESAVNAVRQFESVKLPLKEQFAALNGELGITEKQFEKIRENAKRLDGDQGKTKGLQGAIDGVSRLTFAYNNVETAVGSMVAKINPAYTSMIAANEKLNQQLLQSAASITATSQVSGADGAQLKNIDSIRALQPKLKETIREVEIATQSLVGVTSEQTSEVFNVILTNTGKLNGQLKSATDGAEKFKDPLDAAAKLAPGLVATLGTMGLPISQAADEVGNLLKGEIDQSAQVAKSLGITREMIESWKAQGVLVDKLTQKFDPFLKANAEAARSVSGITSNIQDMFEITTREAGKPVTKMYVDALQGVYEYLQKVMPSVQKVFSDVIEAQLTTIGKVAEAVKPAFLGIMSAIESIAPTIGPLIQSQLGLLGNLATALTPAFQLVGAVIAAVGQAVGALIPVFIKFKESFGLVATLTAIANVATAVLGPSLGLIVGAIQSISGAIKAIAENPFGSMALQAIALTVALSPMVIALLKISTVIATFASVSAYLSGAIAGIQTLVIVAAQMVPLGGTIVAGISAIGVALSTAFAPAIAAFTTGGITAGLAALGTVTIPAITAAIGGLAASFGTATLAAAPFLLALAPLIAIGGAIAVTLAVKGEKDLENAQTELDALRSTSNDISDAALKNAQKLKALSEASASGGLSAKQKQEQKDLIFGGKQQIKLIDDQIAAIKKQKQESQGQGASQEQLNQFDAQQKQLENTQKTLSKYADAVKIASQELAILGTANEQIAQKVKAAQGIIDGGVGDPTKFKESAKLLSDLTQKQVQLGTITAEAGAATLAKLQTNTKLDYESQLAAKEAIVKIYSDRFAKIDELQSSGKLSNSAAEAELQQVQQNTDLEVKTRKEAGKKIIELRKETMEAELAELAAGSAKIEAQKAQGTIGEAEAAKQTSAIKVQESQKRLEQLRKEADLETNPEVKRKLVADVAKTESEITKIKAEEINRRNAERLKDFDEQDKLLQAQLDKGATSEESYNNQKRSLDQAKATEEISQLTAKLGKLKSTDKEGREAINAQIAEAESKREQALKAANDREIATLQAKLDRELALVKAAESEKLLAIAQSVKSGEKTQAQADVETARAAAEAAQKLIEIEEQKLDKLRSLPSPNNPKDAEALAKQITDQQAKFADARVQALTKQNAIEKALIAEVAAANQKANEEIERSQKANLEKVSKAELEALKKAGADVEALARATAKSSLAEERIAANEKYSLKQEELAKLKALIESGQISGDAAIEAEKKLQKELSDINLQRISLEKKALEDLRAEKVRQIELESQNSINPLQKKIDLLNQQKTILEQQNALISAQDRLESASFNLAKQRTGFAIEDAKAAKDEGLAKQLEMQAAGDQLAFTRQQNISKLESVQLSLEQKAIDAQMAKLNAEIATIQSQANLQKAIAEGKSKEVIAALTREVELRGKQESLTAKAAENQKTIGGKELAAARIEAQTAEERDTRAYNKTAAANGGQQIATQAAVPTRYQPGATADRFESKNSGIDKPTEAESKAAERLADVITRSINGEAPRKGADQPIEPKKASKSETSRDPLALADFGKALDGAAVAAKLFSARLGGSQGPAQTGITPIAPQGEQKPQRSAAADPVSNAIAPLTSAVQSNTQALKDGGVQSAQIQQNQVIGGGQVQQNQVVGGGQIQPNQVIGGGNLTPPIDEATKKLEAETTTAADSNKKLGESSTTAASAITKLTTSFQSATPVIPIPARFTGGPVSAGMAFTGAEMGPELARYGDGSYDMLMQPGIYNLSRAAQIIPAHETQQILQNSSMMTSNSTIVNAWTTIDNSDVIHELRQLRSIVANRRPMVSNNVTFDRPSADGSDRAFAEFSRMLVRAI